MAGRHADIPLRVAALLTAARLRHAASGLMLAAALLVAGCASSLTARPVEDVHSEGAAHAGRVSPSADEPLAWTSIAGHKGLRYARDAGTPGQVLHWLKLDLRDPNLSLTLTPEADKGRTLPQFNGATDALAALNASFFTASFEPRGWTVSQGQPWSPVVSATDSPALSCDRQQHCTMALDRPVAAPRRSWLSVGGTPWLVRDGRARQPTDDAGCGFCVARHPRTAAGLDAEGRMLTFVLVEGRQADADGLSLADLAARLVAQGVHRALNLDGGGSTALLIQGRLVTGRPFNEPALRPLANALLIKSATDGGAAPAKSPAHTDPASHP